MVHTKEGGVSCPLIDSTRRVVEFVGNRSNKQWRAHASKRRQRKDKSCCNFGCNRGVAKVHIDDTNNGGPQRLSATETHETSICSSSRHCWRPGRLSMRRGGYQCSRRSNAAFAEQR